MRPGDGTFGWEHDETIRPFKPQVVWRLAQETPTALPATLGNRKVKRL